MAEKKGFPMPLEVEYPKDLEGWEESIHPCICLAKIERSGREALLVS